MSVALLFLFVVGCSGSENITAYNEPEVSLDFTSLQTMIEELQNENEELRAVLERAQNESGSEDAEEPPPIDAEIEIIETDPEPQITEVDVVFTNKINIPRNRDAWRFSDRVEFIIDVTNNTDTDIRGVQGVVEVQNLFGVEIMSVRVDFTGQTIPARETTTFTGMGIDINEFRDSDVRLWNEDFEDLNFVYTVEMIVFAD
jgi:hypothetical protein